MILHLPIIVRRASRKTDGQGRVDLLRVNRDRDRVRRLRMMLYVLAAYDAKDEVMHHRCDLSFRRCGTSKHATVLYAIITGNLFK
jgi:hypothetical protein